MARSSSPRASTLPSNLPTSTRTTRPPTARAAENPPFLPPCPLLVAMGYPHRASPADRVVDETRANPFLSLRTNPRQQEALGGTSSEPLRHRHPLCAAERTSKIRTGSRKRKGRTNQPSRHLGPSNAIQPTLLALAHLPRPGRLGLNRLGCLPWEPLEISVWAMPARPLRLAVRDLVLAPAGRRAGLRIL